MNRLHIMLNNRRRFVISAASGALLVLLTGSANALAQVTVRCVPSHTLNSTCYNPAPSPEYTTITLAVSAANPGDVIFVGPGTYNESVTITHDAALIEALEEAAQVLG